jgi:hypothetical protein
MRINRRLLFAGLISAVVGAGAIIVSISFNHPSMIHRAKLLAS